MKLIVTKFKDGSVIRQSTSNPLWGSIMLATSRVSLSNGILNTQNLRGFVRGTLEQLEALNLSAGMDFSASVQASRIIIQETIAPAYDGHEPKQYPDTHKTLAGQVIVDVEGNAIYRDLAVVADSDPRQDVLVLSSTAASEEVTPSVVKAETGDMA